MKHLPFFLILILYACKPVEKTEQTATAPTITQASDQAASNKAIIQAKLVSIDDFRDSDGPCSKAACKAVIKIENIKQKGKLFQLENTEELLPVFFAFTIGPANSTLFPGLKTSYPGLSVNDIFEAEIECRPALGDSYFYTIYAYKKHENNSQKQHHIEK